MTPTQARFVELEKRKNEVKKFFEELNEATKAVAAEIGVNGMFQDPDGTVYKVIKPDGKYVHFEEISYIRTRRLDEKRGELSLTEAEAAGFTVPKK